ncbi:MAG: type II toxin-antitoxin system VapC family toxin [bacterium]
MILLDTNAFIWWLSDRDKLSSRALSSINSHAVDNKILISSMSIWEICLLVQKKRIDIHDSLENWVSGLKKLPDLEFIPIDNDIAYQATNLPGIFHKDPADRIIVATARFLGATLITSDKLIFRYKHVKTIW